MEWEKTIELLSSVRKTDKATKKILLNCLKEELYGKTKHLVVKIRKRKAKSRTYSEEQVRKVLKLRAEGNSLRQISRETGVRTGSIHHALKRAKELAGY